MDGVATILKKIDRFCTKENFAWREVMNYYKHLTNSKVLVLKLVS